MRLLLFAPVDLNLIDGSAIWCASVTQMLLQNAQVCVDLLLHAPLKRTINIAGFADSPRFRLLNPWQAEAPDSLYGPRGQLGARLTPAQAAAAIERLHADQAYNLLILRGGPICRLVARVPHLAARSWFYLTQHDADLETMTAIARSNGRVACQTPLLQEFFERMLGPAPERFVPLPPMVPQLRVDRPRTARGGRRLCYIGKFDSDYCIEELIAAFVRIRRELPNAELVVAGDKFYDPTRGGAFERRVTAALRGTPGIVWHGGLPREEVGALLAHCDLGACWRTSAYDASLEVSTKALEYAAAGLPLLLNPSRINRLVFGEDYPLYVDSPERFRDCVLTVFRDPAVYRQAAETAFEACRGFTFDSVGQLLRPHLAAYRPRVEPLRELDRPRRLVFAGHDLKFCGEIVAHFEARGDWHVRLDRWGGHEQHNERHSEELVRWADAIWCEWCLGNAVWYSERVRPGQNLVVRLHRQEVTTSHYRRVAWPNVRHLVFIAPHVRDTLLAELGPAALPRVHLIYNTVDCAALACEKRPGAEHHLGLLGYCPKLKNPRLAVEILAQLLEHDDRWRLLLAGHGPEHYAWLWSHPDERAYYEDAERYIAARDLGGYLIRQGWTDDLPGWYAQVGFMLSTSDLEGSHQVVAEGMATGCIPIVRRWPGAAEMYPNSQLFDTPCEAAELILRNSAPQRRAELADRSRHEARDRFDLSVILPQLEPLLLGAPVSPADHTAAMAEAAEWTAAQARASSIVSGSPALTSASSIPLARR
jgi:glycosyltransferase involved in cell wall biosynthesis